MPFRMCTIAVALWGRNSFDTFTGGVRASTSRSCATDPRAVADMLPKTVGERGPEVANALLVEKIKVGFEPHTKLASLHLRF